MKKEIRKTRELTDRPFGVNIMLLSPYAEDIARLAAEEKVPVVTTGAGNPGPYMKQWKEAGIKVIPVVASVALAKMMQRGGADAVIAEGCESGGHIGEATTMVLVPQVADAVSVPVVAAGGIGDGRGFAAAMMLGAAGVQMGTRFLVSDECVVHQNYKEEVCRIIRFVREFGEQHKKYIPVITAGGFRTHADLIHQQELGADGIQAATRFVVTEECGAARQFKEAYVKCRKEDIAIIKSPVGMPGRAIRNAFICQVQEHRISPTHCYQCLSVCSLRRRRTALRRL